MGGVFLFKSKRVNREKEGYVWRAVLFLECMVLGEVLMRLIEKKRLTSTKRTITLRAAHTGNIKNEADCTSVSKSSETQVTHPIG